ncbi:MAG: hypothetical protein ACSHX8_10030 [Opitutaceae bacterium]
MFKQYITYTLTVFLGIFAITATAHSQATEIPLEATATKAPKLRALTIGYENDLKELELLDANLQSVGKLSLRQFTFSKGFTCPIVAGKLTFGVPNGTDEQGLPLFKPVASVQWKDSYQQVCLVFIPKSLAGKRNINAEYAVQVLDMSTREFKLGHTKVINLTPLDAMVGIGEHKASLKPWSQNDISKVTELTGVKMAQISVFYKYNDKIHNAEQTRFRYLEDARFITLIYPDAKNKRIAVKVVKDFGNLY